MSNITYKNKNIIPLLNSSDWELVNATQNGDYSITISPGGYVRCLVTSVENTTYSYYKTSIDVTCEGLDNESNFNNRLALNINHIYYDYNHVIALAKDDRYTVNTFNPVRGHSSRYTDTNEMENRPYAVAFIEVVVYNGTESDAIIHSLKLFISQDINQSQASEQFNDSIESSRFSRITVGLNESAEYILRVKAYSSGEAKLFNIAYTNDRVSGFSTNFGGSTLIDYEIISSSSDTITE